MGTEQERVALSLPHKNPLKDQCNPSILPPLPPSLYMRKLRFRKTGLSPDIKALKWQRQGWYCAESKYPLSHINIERKVSDKKSRMRTGWPKVLSNTHKRVSLLLVINKQISLFQNCRASASGAHIQQPVVYLLWEWPRKLNTVKKQSWLL